MIRPILTELALFIAPFVAFAIFLMATKTAVFERGSWPPKTLAGLAIAIGEIADATIVIGENCTAELSLHPFASRDEKQEILIHSIASKYISVRLFS